MESRIITVIICCYNSEKKIRIMLEKLLRCNKIKDYVERILVVDNNSKDSTSTIVRSISEENEIVKVLFEPKQGLSNARRRGVENTNTEWIVFLDDDNYVDQNWIEEAYQYIMAHPDVGVFNGMIVPKQYKDMEQEERCNLAASYTVLACTHLSREKAHKSGKTPFRVPIGAGMVIRTAPLKEMLSRGWLNSAGRTANDMTSGEDTEMSQYVMSQGFKKGFCNTIVIEHDLGIMRLKTEYLERLWYGNGAGAYLVSRTYPTLLRWGYSVLLRIRLRKYYFTNKRKYRFYKKYIEGYRNGRE